MLQSLITHCTLNVLKGTREIIKCRLYGGRSYIVTSFNETINTSGKCLELARVTFSDFFCN